MFRCAKFSTFNSFFSPRKTYFLLKTNRRVKGSDMVTAGDLASGGKRTIQYTHDVLQNWTFETHTVSSVSVTAISLIEFF